MFHIFSVGILTLTHRLTNRLPLLPPLTSGTTAEHRIAAKQSLQLEAVP